jgi:hypothetical protein
MEKPYAPSCAAENPKLRLKCEKGLPISTGKVKML